MFAVPRMDVAALNAQQIAEYNLEFGAW